MPGCVTGRVHGFEGDPGDRLPPLGDSGPAQALVEENADAFQKASEELAEKEEAREELPVEPWEDMGSVDMASRE